MDEQEPAIKTLVGREAKIENKEVKKVGSILIAGVRGERKGLEPLHSIVGILEVLLGTPGLPKHQLRAIIMGIILLVTDSQTGLRKVTGFLSSYPQGPPNHHSTFLDLYILFFMSFSFSST